MSLPGKFSVGATGAATYNIPIAVPPGTAGLTPSLSLEYNSQSGNGLLGIGWSLGGLPSIGRCSRTIAQDGAVGGINYDANDRFCMDGQRLVAVSGTYGADGAVYRTEVDTFSKLISHGTAGNGPAWFEVHTKSGQIMEFGHTTDSLVLAQGKSAARNWALDKVSDSKGNYFTITYTNDTTNGQAYPIEIDYTGNIAANVSPNDKVQFIYATRPDITPQYQAGSLSQTTVRLTDVKAYAGSTLVSDYQLAYQQSPSSKSSEIASMIVCGGSGACLPATSFQWISGGGASFSGQVWTVPSGANFGTPIIVGGIRGVGATGGIGYTQFSSDFNGDGKADFLMLYGPYLFTFLSNGDGTYSLVTSNAPNGWNFGNTPSSNFSFVTGDFNGDGRTDFAMLGGTYLYVFLSSGDGTFRGVTFPCPNGWNFGNPPASSFTPISGDFDGDGRTDFLMIGGQYLYEFMSNGDGTFAGSTIQISTGWNFSNPPTSGFTPISGDFNGDGKTDFVMMGGAYLYEFLSNGNGSFSYNTIEISNGWNFGNPPSSNFMPIIGDFNGDAKSDWVMLAGQYLYEFQSRGDGTFNYITLSMGGWDFGNPGGANFIPFGGDFNADGKADFVMIGGNGPYIYEFVSNGDGTFSYNTIGMPNSWNFGAPPTTNYWAIAGDLNGDGKSDFALMDAMHVYTVTTDGSPGDLITSVTSSLGTIATITYVSLTSGSAYTKDSGANAASYPVLDVQSPVYVVSQVNTSNGVGGTYDSRYSYAGAKLDLSGRGFVGFRQMAEKDLQTGISETTNYRQDFPYVGLVSSTIRSFSTTTLGQSTNTFQFSNASGSATIGPASAPYQVSLSQNVSSGADLDGSALPTVTTSNQYDSFGNATQVVVSTSDGYGKTTINTYTNDTTNWYLGRLTQSSVTSVAP
jgi:hypothetical protein